MKLFPASLFLSLQVLIFIPGVNGQRIKEGCFDASSISCNNPRVKPEDVDFSIQEVCKQLAVEVFPSDDIVFNPPLHPDYLNSIEANSEFCSQVEIAYSQCLFCEQSWSFVSSCIDEAFYTQCGGQPDRQQVLADNFTFAYYETNQDIDTACADLQDAYDWSIPLTIDLCEKQSHIKHLCPGQCEGTCFDPVEYPPTCDPKAYQGPVNETLDTREVCDTISAYAFYFTGIEVIMDATQPRYTDYFKAVPNEMCNEARQAFSQCAWCDKEMCFNDKHPVSCERPESEVETTLEEDEKVCQDIFFSLYEFDYIKDMFNVSKHTKHLGIKNNTNLCDQARRSYYKCYWCVGEDAPLDFCTWGSHCRGDAPLPEGFVSSTLQALNMTDLESPEEKCNEIYNHWNEHWSDQYTLHNCHEDQYLAQLCPDYFCRKAEPATVLKHDYLGATNTLQKRSLVWMSRVSAFLSLCGGSYILYDILSDRKNKKTVYHELLLGMATFDLVTAVAWGFATAPIDREAASHIEGAMGTEATCTAQAFFVQLGFASVFYNVSLAIYYVLVVAYDWREFQLKKIRLFLHFLPPFIGFGLALGAIPKYHWLEYGCHILPHPEGDMWAILVFVVLPIGLAILVIMACMMMVYCKVRTQAAAASKWSFGVSKASALQQAVFWQCLFYALAFLVTWPILFSVYLASVDVHGPLGLTLTVAFLAPLQGFLNFTVYIRPKLAQKKKRKSTSSSQQSSRRPSMLAGLRNSIQKRTIGSRFFDITASLRKGKDEESGTFNSVDPSVLMAFQDSANGFHDSGLSSSKRPSLPALEEINDEGNERQSFSAAKSPDPESDKDEQFYDEDLK